MIENKRFTITQDFEEHHRQIRDNNRVIMGCFLEPQAEVIVDLLNKLNDENEQLKRQIGNLEHTRDFVGDVCADCNRLEKENEKLKKDVEFYKGYREDLEETVIENEQLKSEINMLKTTISRNEAYIKRLTHKGEWKRS